jgi:hypothetical protein
LAGTKAILARIAEQGSDQSRTDLDGLHQAGHWAAAAPTVGDAVVCRHWRQGTQVAIRTLLQVEKDRRFVVADAQRGEPGRVHAGSCANPAVSLALDDLEQRYSAQVRLQAPYHHPCELTGIVERAKTG